MWLDRRGARLKAGGRERAGPAGWHCRCCGYRIYRQSRDAPRGKRRDAGDGADLEHFDKHRALMLGALGGAIAEREAGGSARSLDELLPSWATRETIESEFEAGMDSMLELAHSDMPNKVSLIAELEMLKFLAGEVPTAAEIEAAGRFSEEEYEAEFASMGHLLERLGYDPWHRERRPPGAPRDGGERRRPRAAEDLERANAIVAGALRAVKAAGGRWIAASEVAASLGVPEKDSTALASRLASMDGIISEARGGDGGPTPRKAFLKYVGPAAY